MAQLPPSLSNLPHHAIFVPPSSKSKEDWELVAPEYAPKTSKVVMREKDLIVAHDREVRLAHLGEGWDVVDTSAGKYKTLVSEQLDFDIQSLVVNPTGRLLAVVGKNQAVVLVLPKTGSTQVLCRSFVVDPFQFSPSSLSTITKVLWHPWGESGNSLWVLTSDGKLREYDVLDPEDPMQTFTFLTPSPPSTFSAVDPLSRYATSFSFSPFTNDFGATVVNVLCANGDLYYMGPILPLQAEVPSSWLQGVRAIGDREGGLKSGWVDSILKQIQSGPKTDAASKVRLHPPHLTVNSGPAPGLHRPLLRQGPVLLDPAPEEAEDEDRATDLLLLENDGEVVYAICWTGGRVDLGMMIDTPNPRWVSTKDRTEDEPTLSIVDSVLLPVDDTEANAPSLVLDPLHKDSFYIQHSSGCDAISIQPWIIALREEADLPPSDVVRLIESSHPIIGALTFCDVTFGYGLGALASTYQLATVELDLVAGSTNPSQAIAKPSSLLKPLNFDDLLKSTRSADYRSLARAVPPISALSGHNLRAIANIITQMQSQIEAIRTASKAIENHLDLCAREFHRQIRAVKQCRTAIDGLEGKAPVKVFRMLERQEQLMERLDKVMDVMSNEYQPEVGEVEKKWFDELETLKGRPESLAAKAKAIQEQLEALRPALEAAKPDLKAIPDDYGEKQIRPLQSAVAQRSEEITRLMRKMESLSVRMDMKLEERGDQ